MKGNHQRSLIVIFVAFLSTAAYSAYDQQCLDDCFSTHHECGYCAWACESNPTPMPRVYSHFKCPISQGYQGEHPGEE